MKTRILNLFILTFVFLALSGFNHADLSKSLGYWEATAEITEAIDFHKGLLDSVEFLLLSFVNIDSYIPAAGMSFADISVEKHTRYYIYFSSNLSPPV